MSGKDKKKPGDIRGNFINTQQTEAYRQLMKTEGRILQKKNKSDLERMKDLLGTDMNYLSLYKREDFAATQSMKMKAEEDTVEQFYKSLPFHSDTVNNFDPKTKKDRSWAVHKAREGPLATEVYKLPLTTAQEIGWMKPIDTLSTGYGLKNSFPEAIGAHNFRDSPKKKEK